MRSRTWLGAFTMLGVVALGPIGRAADEATLLRVFLVDGASLVSYGEPARIGDRVVFSMPTDATEASPLHLVDLPASRVDWDRTSRYGLAARGARYERTQAAADYASLASDISQTLTDIAAAPEASRRLALAEGARKRLAAWPESHFNYREADVKHMLSLLDEAITGLRAASGVQQFDLSFTVSAGPAAAAEPLLPAPTLKEAIEQVLTAARVVDSPAERSRLLRTALVNLDRDAAALPAAWVARTRAETRAGVRTEERIDRWYQELTSWMMGVARWRARRADVRGVERLGDRIRRHDLALGQKRPDAVGALLAAVDAELDAARRLRQARAQFALRAPVLQRYRLAIAAPLDRMARLTPALERIKSAESLSNTPPASLSAVDRAVARVLEQASAIAPPEELAAAHATFVSAAQLAGRAAQIRAEAIQARDLTRTREASSAAAGALLLGARARSDIQTALRPPQLP